MAMSFKNLTISLIIVLAVGFSAWSTFLSHNPSHSVQIDGHPTPPDAIIEGMTTLIMDEQGKPSMKIITPKMVHFTENDTTQLNSPQITLYRKSTNPWYVTANYGKATFGVDNIDFWENVVIHHAADERNPATLIKTKSLTVHPHKKTAETKDPIMMIQPDLVVNAVGLTADMNTGEITLLSQARGEYVPPH